MRHIELPAGTHYALLDAIPARFNGMTTSTLQRSRALVEHAGVDVTILTWEDRPDHVAVCEKLRADGTLVDGMRIVNMWEAAREWDDAYLASAAFDRPAPEAIDVSQRTVLRADGTALAVFVPPESGAEEPLVLCDRQGRPLGAWNSVVGLQTHWLDSLPRNPVAWMIFDSKVSAAMLAGYQRPDVVKIHVVRGSHLKRGQGPMRELVASRKPVLENLDAWDSVTFLTKSQRDDVAARFGDRPNLHVIPNSRDAPSGRVRLTRPAGRGVMIASLEARKRISHAVRAMARVQRRTPRRRPHLDVYGAGPMEAELRELIRAKRAPVTLRGYSADARNEFSKASFSLLTSRSEGLPGVVIESMGRGCIPISYDMPYGPSDIITHGVDGFLVPNADIDALAERIAHVATMRRKEVVAMRQAAYRRGQDFNDEHAVERWAALLATIAQRRGF